MSKSSERCSLYLDMDEEPMPGHFIITMLSSGVVGSVYLVECAREVKRKKPAPSKRWSIQAFRSNMADLRAAPDKTIVWELHWYKRKKAA